MHAANLGVVRVPPLPTVVLLIFLLAGLLMAPLRGNAGWRPAPPESRGTMGG
jgi:hypothetical protein